MDDVIKLYLKKNGYKQNTRHPDYRHDFVLKQDIHFKAGEPISLAGWFDVQMKTLTIHLKHSDRDIKKTE